MGVAGLTYLLLPALASILAGAGYAVTSFAPPDYVMARRCFGVAGALFVAVIIVWGCVDMIDNRPFRIAVVGIASAVVAVLTVEAIVWAAKKRVTDARAPDVIGSKSEDKRQAQNNFSVKFTPVDYDQIGGDKLEVDFAFINRTDQDVIVRSVFLNQAMISKKPYNGEADYEAPCRSMNSISPDASPLRFRGWPVQLKDGTLVSSYRSSMIRESFVIPARKSITLRDTYPTRPLSGELNLMFYCPAVSFIDTDGNDFTAHCSGVWAGLTTGENGLDGGRVRAGSTSSAVILPRDQIKNCVISKF